MVDPVIVTAPRPVPAPQLSQLDLLLQQSTPRTYPPTSDMQRLMSQPRADSTFQELLKKEFKPRDVTRIDEVVVKAKKFSRARNLMRVGARAALPLSLFFGVYDVLDYVVAKQGSGRKPKLPNARFTVNPDAQRRSTERNRFADGDYLPTGVDVIGDTLLEPITVTARALRTGPNRLASYDPFGIQSLFGTSAVPRGASNPRTAPKTFEEHLENIGYPGTRRDPLTRRQPEGVRSPRTKTQPRLDPISPTRDTCVREKRDRNACPARGYRIKIVKTEKVPCR